MSRPPCQGGGGGGGGRSVLCEFLCRRIPMPDSIPHSAVSCNTILDKLELQNPYPTLLVEVEMRERTWENRMQEGYRMQEKGGQGAGFPR